MPIDVVRKINPFLAKMMFNRAIVPIIIETDRPEMPRISSLLQDLHFPIVQKIGGFGMIASMARPENIKSMAMDESVLAIHYDMPKFALVKMPFLDIEMPNVVPTGLTNPFANVPLPSFLPQISKQKKSDEFLGEYNTTFETRKQIGAEKANNEGITGKGVKLGTIDTGIDPTHPQIKLRVGIKSSMKGQYADLNGHGTHCITTNSGAYARHPLNGIEVMGVAHEADRLSYKSLGYIIGAGSTSDVIKAMEMAYEDGCQVISMSLGSEESQGGYKTDPECRVVQALSQAGVMVVVAAGNSGPNARTMNNPAISPDAITVGAIDPRTFQIADFSSRGPTPIDGLIKPDVVGAGVDIYSGSAALLDGIGDKVVDRYAILSGTSMATPHVAGLCALLKQKYPEMNSYVFKQIMSQQGAKNNDYGWGFCNWDQFNESDVQRAFDVFMR